MNRMLCIVVCLITVLFCVGCNSNNDSTDLMSGNYYVQGDYEEMLTPYLWLNTEDYTFSMSRGSILSYADNGTYKVSEGKIIATSQSTTFVFEIKNSKTLILTYNGDDGYFKIPLQSEFVYSNELK